MSPGHPGRCHPLSTDHAWGTPPPSPATSNSEPGRCSQHPPSSRADLLSTSAAAARFAASVSSTASSSEHPPAGAVEAAEGAARRAGASSGWSHGHVLEEGHVQGAYHGPPVDRQRPLPKPTTSRTPALHLRFYSSVSVWRGTEGGGVDAHRYLRSTYQRRAIRERGHMGAALT